MSESLQGKSNKKICFITTVPVTLKLFVLPAADYLYQQTSYDVTMICDDDAAFAASLPPYIHYIPVSMKRGISLGGIGAMLKMMRIFRKEKFDMVQYSTPNASLYAALAAKLTGIPVRKYHLMGLRYLGFSGCKKRIFKTVERITCLLSTDIECVSVSNRTLGVNDGLFSLQKSSIILNGSSSGVDCTRFDIRNRKVWRNELRRQLGYESNDCVFGYVGRITGDKGINELLKAFERAEIDNGKLLLIGAIEYGQTIDKSLIESARNDNRVIFHLPVEDIERYYAAMDVLILPSYREGFGMVVVEAEAMGVPVIVTDIPGPTDAMIPDKTGLVVKKADVDSLVSAMRELAGSAEKRERLGAAGHSFAVENFEQQRLFQAILQDRKRLLGEE